MADRDRAPGRGRVSWRLGGVFAFSYESRYVPQRMLKLVGAMTEKAHDYDAGRSERGTCHDLAFYT